MWTDYIALITVVFFAFYSPVLLILWFVWDIKTRLEKLEREL